MRMTGRARAPKSAMFQKDEVLKALHTRLVAAGPATFWRSVVSAVPLFVSLLIWHPAGASAAAPTCVVKLKVSANEGSDGGTKAFVTKVLTGQGYKIIDDWLFTMWRASDYDVQIVMTYTLVQNYGFPVTLMDMQLFIADSTGKVLVDSDIDRANLEDNLKNSIPVCK